MKQYTLYCTKEQTRKALELGAPIETCGYYFKQQVGCNTISDTDLHIIPTAEEMIGWLEEKGLIIEIYECNGYFFFAIFHKEGLGSFASRKEATLAAIDAALNYLTSKK